MPMPPLKTRRDVHTCTVRAEAIPAASYQPLPMPCHIAALPYRTAHATAETTTTVTHLHRTRDALNLGLLRQGLRAADLLLVLAHAKVRGLLSQARNLSFRRRSCRCSVRQAGRQAGVRKERGVLVLEHDRQAYFHRGDMSWRWCGVVRWMLHAAVW